MDCEFDSREGMYRQTSQRVLQKCWNIHILLLCLAHSFGSSVLEKRGSNSHIHCQLTKSDDIIISRTKWTGDSLDVIMSHHVVPYRW